MIQVEIDAKTKQITINQHAPPLAPIAPFPDLKGLNIDTMQNDIKNMQNDIVLMKDKLGLSTHP
jgi:hypothetical protein